jgi:ATPase family associated with various cellular activities (AAA)
LCYLESASLPKPKATRCEKWQTLFVQKFLVRLGIRTVNSKSSDALGETAARAEFVKCVLISHAGGRAAEVLRSITSKACLSYRGRKSVARDLFAKFQHQTSKGFLLYGSPECGKTLIGKATAYNLTRQLKEKTGEDMQQFFMHIKGPEILNMWVGESERMVREIFATAREKRKEGFLPFVFIDEAESILGTRRAGRFSNVLSTLVPMFCTEIDEIESLNEVVIIVASNRADLIDPAILRPGRIDRKIKVDRPDREASREIYRIY